MRQMKGFAFFEKLQARLPPRALNKVLAAFGRDADHGEAGDIAMEKFRDGMRPLLEGERNGDLLEEFDGLYGGFAE